MLAQIKDVRQLLELTVRWESMDKWDPQIAQKNLPQSYLWKRSGWIFVDPNLSLNLAELIDESGFQDLQNMQHRTLGNILLESVLIIYCCNNLSQIERKQYIFIISQFLWGWKQSVSQGWGFIWRLKRGKICSQFSGHWQDSVPQGLLDWESQFFHAVRLKALVPHWLLARGHPNFMLCGPLHMVTCFIKVCKPRKQ